MKKEMIVALSNRGKENEDKVEQEFDIPENLTEALQVCNGDEKEVFKYFLAAYKVQLQNSIRKPPARKVGYLIDTFKNLMSLVESNTITMEQAREASGYHGEWPLPKTEGETPTE